MSKIRNFKKIMQELNTSHDRDATPPKFERPLPVMVRLNDRPIRADELKERVLTTIETGGVYIYSGTDRLENLKQLTPELNAMGLKVRIYSQGAMPLKGAATLRQLARLHTSCRIYSGSPINEVQS